VPATIGGKTYVFELDTGAAMNIVDPALRPFLGAYQGSETVDSFGHFIEVKVFEGPSIGIGRWSLPPSRTGVTDLNHFRTQLGVDIRGYIGTNLLKDYSLSLDYDRGTMEILKDSTRTTLGMESIGLSHLNGSTPFIKCNIDGETGESMEFVIDTGSISYLGLRHESFVSMSESGTIEIDGNGMKSVETGSGRTLHRTGRFTRGTLLGVNLRNTPVDDTNSINTIGLRFLSNFNAVIDLKSARFFYKRRSVSPPIYKSVFQDIGITFPGDRNYIFRLDPRGPMANAGLKVGDHIVGLGSLKEAEINAISIYRLCLDHAGEMVELRVQRSGEDDTTTLRVRLPKKEAFVCDP
jgi:hypothetical protein